MFSIETKALETAMNAARQLKAMEVILYTGKHGVLFGTRSDSGTFLNLLSDVKQQEVSVKVNIEDLGKAAYQLKQLDMEVNNDHISIKSKKIRSVIRLPAEHVEVPTMLELWESRNEGHGASMLAKMLGENRALFSIKDHVGGKPIPVHIRWNKDGVAAGMSDQYHGVSIRTNSAPTEKKGAKELFVYSSWLPLLIDYLVPPEAKKGEEKVKPEKALLHITDTQISVSTKHSLLVLAAIVPGADVITLDDVSRIASAKAKSKVNLSMADVNAALRRALAVLPIESSIKFAIKADKPERLRIQGVHGSGGQIVEEVTTSRSKEPVGFACTVYNLLDITSGCTPECSMSLADKALLFHYDFAAKSDTVYSVHLFSATIPG